MALSATGRLTRTYYFINGQRIALREQRSDGLVVYFLHGDALGSASLVTGLTGTVLSSLRYTPYGLPRSEAGSLPTPYRYTGQRETGVGFYDYQARLYDPAVGRFVQADTIVPEPGNPQSLNRYGYVLGNPLKYIDPTGHDLMIVGGIGGDLTISTWKAWIMEYKNWDDDQWNIFYESWKSALGFDPATEIAGALGDDTARFAAANAVLAESGIGVFTWGGSTWNEALANARSEKVIDLIGQLSREMAGRSDIVLVGWSKGANLVMNYMNEMATNTTLEQPDDFVLIAPPTSRVSRMGGPAVGIHNVPNQAPVEFGTAQVAHLCAADDWRCAGNISNAMNFSYGLSGHGPHPQMARDVYVALKVREPEMAPVARPH